MTMGKHSLIFDQHLSENYSQIETTCIYYFFHLWKKVFSFAKKIISFLKKVFSFVKKLIFICKKSIFICKKEFSFVKKLIFICKKKYFHLRKKEVLYLWQKSRETWLIFNSY